MLVVIKTVCMFNNRCISSVSNCFQTSVCKPSLMKESMITVRLQYYINFARALFLAAEVTCNACLFVFCLFTHTFLILILQTASYWLMLISGGCGVLWSTRVVHTKLKRPGTWSYRLGPDSADHLKYRPEPVRVPGWVPGPWISGLPWRPLVCISYYWRKRKG